MTIRTYETCSIRWERGTTVTGYDRAGAEDAIERAEINHGEHGELIVNRFEVELPTDERLRAIYLPGIIADREQ
jgi:hypothetical protein